MTNNEAITVINLLLTADGSCCDCASKLIIKFIKEFPQHQKLATEIFHTMFDFELELSEE